MNEFNLDMRKQRLQVESSQSADILFSRFRCGLTDCMICWCDGMIDKEGCFERVFKTLSDVKPPKYLFAESLAREIRKGGLLFDARSCKNEAQAVQAVYSGFSALFINGLEECFIFDQQGFAHRNISESYTEENVRSPREGFAEPIGINVTLVRRRLQTGKLCVEYLKLGSVSNTTAAVVYLKDAADDLLVREVREKAAQVNLPIVFETGFIEPFFRERRSSLFSAVGHTERPDVFCAKLNEGRVGILLDGTPFALTVPQLFIENFQSFDDYSQKAYFASFIRVLKFISFFVAVMLPGSFVAAATHSIELFGFAMVRSLASAEQAIGLPIVVEALFIQLVYEIVREGGLRLPRPIGHAVSLIGALVVGETAIAAGIVGAPMVMIGALTAVCSFTIPKLYQPCAVLRFCFIIIGGTFGLMGIALGLCFIFFNICAIDSFGTPYSAPISPYSNALFSDGVGRENWKKLGRHRFDISDWDGREDENR